MISSGRPSVSRFGVTKTATPSGSSTRAASASNALGIRDVLERLHGEDRREARRAERQRPHVRDDRLALLAGERGRVDVDADGLARREQVEAVADAAAEVEHPARTQLRLAERVRSDVALPGRIEPAGGTRDPLSGDLHGAAAWQLSGAPGGRGRVRAHADRRGPDDHWRRAAAGGRASIPVRDELSTHWIVSRNDLWGVISTVHTDAEITPPLSFVASWLTTRIDFAPEFLRAPSLIAGAATIPLVYLLGREPSGAGRRWSRPRSRRSRRS